jgi:16S rRNA (uracil1498-N3)-methyltransferase
MSERERRIYLKPKNIHLKDENPWADIDPDNTRHLRQALRLGPGAKINIFDGSGREYEAEITDSKPRSMKASILGWTQPETEPRIKITLAQALIKENNFDRILTSCTELGCSSFIPLITSRTVIKVRKADIQAKLERWEKIIERASAQSGRVKVPKIDFPVKLDEFLSSRGERNLALKLILSLKAKEIDLKELIDKPDAGEVIIISGPEGGLDDEEEKQAIEAGFTPISLGPRTLKAETAGAAAISVIQCLSS